MSETQADVQVEGFLDRLDKALASLPPERRSQLLGDIADHINESLELMTQPTEADVRNLLDRIGDPEEISAEALASEPHRSSDRTPAGLQEYLAIALLLVGGAFFFVGWIVGLVLLWTSSIWRIRDKLIGTFLLPGGLLPAFILLIAPTSTSVTSGGCEGTPIPGTNRDHVVCTNTTAGTGIPIVWRIVLLAVLVIIPILTAWHLYRRAKEPQT
jgi:hypothetical protein